MAEQEYSGYGVTGYVPRTNWSDIPFYKNYHFPVDRTLKTIEELRNAEKFAAMRAERFMLSDEFKSFWNRGGVSDDGIGFRVKTGVNPLDASEFGLRTYGRRDYGKLISDRAAMIERTKANFNPNPYLVRELKQPDGSMLRVPVSAEEQTATRFKSLDNAVWQQKNLARIENRFHTPYNTVLQNHLIDGRGLKQYIEYAQLNHRSGSSYAGEMRLPVSMMMDERMPNFSLKNFERFNGVPHAIGDEQVLGGLYNRGAEIGKKYGLELGATVSSNPKEEVFVSATMGNQARRVANVNVDGGVTVVGPADEALKWAARGRQVLNRGGKILLGAGVVGETIGTPRRIQGYYENALREDPNWRPDISDKIGMSFAAGTENALNFATIGLWDQKERIYEDMPSGAGYGKGYYGTMVPPSGMTSVHSNPESRYERVGISFDHIYPQAPR